MLGLIFLVVGVVLIIGAFVPAWISSERATGPSAKSVGGGCLLAIVGALVILFGLGFAEVPAGQVGVVTSFGQIHNETLGPGLHWFPPFLNNVTLMDGRVQVYEFKDISGASSDLQEVTLTGIVNFHLDAAKASEIYQTVGVDYKEKVFTRPADTILKSITPKFKAQDIVGQRVTIGAQTAEALQAAVLRYGIVVDSVNISNIGLSADFLQAIEDKVKAEQEAQRQETLIRVSEAEAKQRIAKANGEAEATRIAAQGQADANALLNSSLTPELIQWSSIQKLNPNVQVIYLPSTGSFILPLPSTGGGQ